jgi:hypothetical protein
MLLSVTLMRTAPSIRTETVSSWTLSWTMRWSPFFSVSAHVSSWVLVPPTSLHRYQVLNPPR